MPRRGRRDVDQVLLMALACGATVEVAAQMARISPATVYRRKQDSKFCKQMQQFQADMVQRILGTLIGAGGEAARTLLVLMKDTEPPTVRLGAARSVIDGIIKVREFASFEERLAALEAQVAQNSTA